MANRGLLTSIQLKEIFDLCHSIVLRIPSSKATLGSHPNKRFASLQSRDSVVGIVGLDISYSTLIFFPEILIILLIRSDMEIGLPYPTFDK